MRFWVDAVFGTGLGLASLAGVAQAQSVAGPTPAPKLALPARVGDAAKTPAVPAAAHNLDKADVEAFFDGILPLQMERGDIGGASVLVMKDGEVLLQKGYGYADVKAKKAVDPNATIFRLASISKLFTWVSVMQLEEQGKLDLDTDVNRYLDFEIHPAFNKPVTLRNLMTHTGGFEEVSDEIIVTDAKKAPSLRDDLIRNQPKRLFPPGEVPAYSNYGVGLASYIVQRISGEPFEQYVQDHIFGPLGMTHSTFYQPPQKALEKLPSEGYRGDTTKPPVGFEIFNPVGAGGLSSTASDMGRFGQALLHGGVLDDSRILKSETLHRMWTPQFQANKELPPICMGFYQDWRNDLRWIGHEGDLIAFHSLFFVEPTQKLVLFVSYNSSNGGSRPRPEIIDFFSDRYFPSDAKPAFLKTPDGDFRAIEGTYQTTRRADSTKLKLWNVMGRRTVKVDKDDVLHLENARDLRGHPLQWKAIGKDLWQESEGQARLFGIREGGKVVRIAVEFPGVQLERVPWYEDSGLVLFLVGGSLMVFAATILANMWRLGRRIFLRKRPRSTPQPGTMFLTWALAAAGNGWVVLMGGILMYLTIAGDDMMPPTPAWFFWFKVINVATVVLIALSVLAAISAWRVWLHEELRWITKIKFSIVGTACVVMCWFAIHWNLIGPASRI